ncbi:MAG: Uncharacterized MFS-type transporter, partial [uncultured Sphingomonadaceae bacterium]
GQSVALFVSAVPLLLVSTAGEHDREHAARGGARNPCVRRRARDDVDRARVLLARHGGPRAIPAVVRADAGGGLRRRPRRPPVDRTRSPAPGAGLRPRAGVSVRLRRRDVAVAVRGRGRARRRARVRRAGPVGVRAQPRAPRFAAERDRAGIDRVADGSGHGAAGRRLQLRRVADARLCDLRRAARLVAARHVPDPPLAAGRCGQVAPLACGDRRNRLRPAQQNRAGRDLSGPVRRAARRRDRDAARLCARHIVRGVGRARHAARGAVDRRGGDRAGAGAIPAQTQGRRDDVLVRGAVRAGDARIRRVYRDVAVGGEPRGARRGGHDQRLRPLLADPAAHAGRDARAGIGGVGPVHLGVERARRVPRGDRGVAVRTGGGGGRGRRVGGRGDRGVRVGVPGAPAGGPFRRAGHCDGRSGRSEGVAPHRGARARRGGRPANRKGRSM